MARIRITTGGGRPAKDKMFERRVQQENLRPTQVMGPPAVMAFGKFKGMLVTEVDDGYLMWCLENMDHCPLYIIGELKRRGHSTGNLSGPAFLTKKQQVRERKKSKKLAIADRQRKQAQEKLAFMQAGLAIDGREYPRLMAEFDRANGDADACPFDTEDYKYMGPTISWNGGTPVIIPSEFPRMYQ